MRLRIALLLVALFDGVVHGQLGGPPPADLAPFVETSRVGPGGTVRAALAVRLPEGLHANSNKPRDPLLIPMVLTVMPPPGITVAEIVYPTPVDLKQENVDVPLSVFERDFTIGVVLTLGRDVRPGAVTVPAELRYQACDDKMCYRPLTLKTGWALEVRQSAGGTSTGSRPDAFGGIAFGTGERPGPAAPPRAVASDHANTAESVGAALATLDRFSIAGSTNYVSTSEFLQFIRDAEAGVARRGLFDGRGPLAIVLIVLLGGIALNLTPCVLPMIPINLAIIGAGTQAGSRARGLLLGAAYGAAMAVVYGGLGLIVVLTAGSFGTINASPWFNLAIAALFVVLALAMFDVITIDFSALSSRFRVGDDQRGTLLVAFAMGAVAALLAGACVAPVVIQVVVLSSNLYAAGSGVALALPFVLGIGMALPWPIAGAGLAALPRPGAWMVRVKQVFGVFIFATAVYYGFTAVQIFASRWVDPAEVTASVEEKLKEGWHPSLAAGLAAAEREGKPVLIDFWATWCKNCLVMDRTTLKDPAVQAALASYVKIKFQAEDLDASPAKEAAERFQVIGLPTYVILQPRNSPDS
jgi:thiol:disulfide interchange protein